MNPVTITLNDQGKIQSVDFVQWIMNEISDKAFTRSHVADTYAILIQKAMSEKGINSFDIVKINTAIIERWSPSGLQWIKTQAWKKARLMDVNAYPRKSEM